MTEPTVALPAEQPRVLAGRYRLDAVIGRGGTAEVWRAQDGALGRTVAVKLVTVPTDEGAHRAGEEARLLAQLSHPSLVPVYDAGTDEQDRPWVVMELVTGETLSEVLKRGPLPSQRTAQVGRAVADALAYVHGQGLVHRDVKPANVLVGADGRVRLTDFGIARLVDAAKITATGLTVGTASYLAPEQVMGSAVGPQADVYALGLVLLECLTGRREYAGSTVEVALARLNRPPVLDPDLPSGWPALLAGMTAREPENRPSAAEVAGALTPLATGEATTATTVLPRVPASQHTQVLPAVPPPARVAPAPVTRTVLERPVPVPAGPRPRSSWPWVAALVLVVALLVAGAYAYSHRTPPLPALTPVSTTVPQPLQDDLRRLRDLVKQ